MGARILIVEDDALLALDLAEHLERAGFTVVGPVGSATKALALLAQLGCDAAVLDVHLGRNQTSEPVAHELRSRSRPYVVVTGYSYEQQPLIFAGATVLSKPVRPAELIAELNRCLGLSSPG